MKRPDTAGIMVRCTPQEHRSYVKLAAVFGYRQVAPYVRMLLTRELAQAQAVAKPQAKP